MTEFLNDFLNAVEAMRTKDETQRCTFLNN